jgi:glycosyltransferase involved in cell wall biosynthesis
MSLKHPCVGLVQHAFWWGKTKEMLILKKVMKSLPNVHFYWVGFGQYQERVLQELTPFDNFHWLGKFPWEEYPENIRKFLTEIDIYALVTGMDTTPLSCREAMSMEKPIVASNVGGIPEMIYDGKTGFLADEGNAVQWVDKISFLVKNENTAKEMGKAARQLIIEKFNWDVIAKSFLTAVTPIIKAKMI